MLHDFLYSLRLKIIHCFESTNCNIIQNIIRKASEIKRNRLHKLYLIIMIVPERF